MADQKEFREVRVGNAVVRIFGKGPSRERLETVCREYWMAVYREQGRGLNDGKAHID